MATAPRFSPIRSQVLEHLRHQLAQGRWSAVMPGSNRLAHELGVSRKTVEAALVGLEQEGLLVNQGGGRRRRIASEKSSQAVRPLQVAIKDSPVNGTSASVALLLSGW